MGPRGVDLGLWGVTWALGVLTWALGALTWALGMLTWGLGVLTWAIRVLPWALEALTWVPGDVGIKGNSSHLQVNNKSTHPKPQVSPVNNKSTTECVHDGGGRSCDPTRPHLQKAQMMVAVGHVIQLGHACIRVASGRHLGAGRHLEDHWETRWALGKTQITVLSAPVAHGTTRVGETRQTSTLMGIESNLERSLSKFAHIITCYAQKCCEEP